MGDECNVARHRTDLESFALKELKKGEKEIPIKRHVRESPSGEPGDEEPEIPNATEDDYFPEVKIVEQTSQDQKSEAFSNEKVKLRPDAVPFTPECVTGTEEIEKAELRFENVDLKSQDDQLIPASKDLIDSQLLKDVKDFTLKPFSLSSTPILKKFVPKLQEMTAEEDAVISIPTNEPPTRDEMVENQPSQSRNTSISFFLINRTQIAVIIASLVICAVLIFYVVL